MKESTETIISVAIVIAGIFGIGYGMAMYKRINDVEETFQNKVDLMLNDKNVDIQQSLIDKSIEKHIERRIGYILDSNIRIACEKTTKEIEQKIYRSIQTKAEKVVDCTYSEMSDEAKKVITKELRDIDVSELRRDVKSEAKKEMMAKLESSMDDILEEYNDKLNSVTSIYESIAKSITSRA